MEIAPDRVWIGEPLPEQGTDDPGFGSDSGECCTHAGNLYWERILAIGGISPGLERSPMRLIVAQFGEEDIAVVALAIGSEFADPRPPARANILIVVLGVVGEGK